MAYWLPSIAMNQHTHLMNGRCEQCVYSASPRSRLRCSDFRLKDAGSPTPSNIKFCLRSQVPCGSLLAASVNLTTAFSSINWVLTWETLWNRGSSEEFVNNYWSVHLGWMMRTEGLEKRSEVVTVTNGIKWGCSLAPLLFIIHFQSYLLLMRMVWQFLTPGGSLTKVYLVGWHFTS